MVVTAGAEPFRAGSPPALSGVRVVVQELQGAATQVWEAAPDAPDDRILLTTFVHQDGYGPRLAHLNGVLQMLAQLSTPSATGASP